MSTEPGERLARGLSFSRSGLHFRRLHIWKATEGARREPPANMMKRSEVSVEDFLGELPPPLRRLAEAARKRILATVPHATERVRPGWRLIGYNAPAYFAFISCDADHVRIGFEWGIMLTNHAGLLEGTGSQVRYVPLRSVRDVNRRELRTLLLSAAAIVPPPRRLG